MNVFPFVGPSALFSDAVIHRFRIRPAAIDSTGRAFVVGAQECTFDFVFQVPVRRDGEPMVQLGRCLAPNGENVSFRVNDEKGGGREGLRVFAGQRADQFFFDGGAAQKTIDTGKLAFKKVGTYLLADQIKKRRQRESEMKKGYWVVAYRSVSDESARQAYSKLSAPAIQAAGGKGLIATTEVESRESGMNQRVVVIEFESLEKAIAAYDSAAYRAARQALGSGADRDFRIVEGM
jgi:uncharacterized protein (DUF1330 family)